MKQTLQDYGIPYIHNNFSRGECIRVGYVGYPVDIKYISFTNNSDAFGKVLGTVSGGKGNEMAALIKEVAPMAMVSSCVVIREGLGQSFPWPMVRKWSNNVDIVLFDTEVDLSEKEASEYVSYLMGKGKIVLTTLDQANVITLSAIPGVITASPTKSQIIVSNNVISYKEALIPDEAGAFLAGVCALYVGFFKANKIPFTADELRDQILHDRSTLTVKMLQGNVNK